MSKVNGAKYHAAPQHLVERILARPYDTNADGCRLWKGGHGRGGYGTATYRVGGRKQVAVYVHRLVYVRLVDDPGDDAEIDHLCHDPQLCAVPPRECPHRRCYELNHLEAVTQEENALRSGSPFALNARKVRCKYGHLLLRDNLIVFDAGGRGCRQCQRIQGRQSWERHGDEILASLRAANAAAHAAREHRCRVCGADIHHRPPHAKFCELCTTDKPIRREARRRLEAGSGLDALLF
jgi:hypothetical protein